jgi:aspartate/methionine/tyrosine aminotransferase
VARLGVGEPDFETPEPIVAAGMRAVRQGWTHYGDLNGDPELRALAADLASGVGAKPVHPRAGADQQRSDLGGDSRHLDAG